MDNLEPITREETLLDGGDLTPITRKEMFIKRIYDKTQSVPEPITREEYFLAKAGEGGGGDITIEQLNVTENGTYSESGKAYRPVVVNVPIPPVPENAYLLNSLSGLPADIASFNDGTDLPMASLKVAVTPYQDLHGYDAPWVGGAGKNKFDSDTVLSTFTKNNNKYVGMPSYVVDNYVISGGFKTNTRYTLSYKAYNNTSTSSNFRFIFSYTDETEEIIGGFVDTTTEKVIVGTSAENKTISKIKRSYGNGVELTLYDIQLEEGSTATSFAPYSNICPIIGWDEVEVVRDRKNLLNETSVAFDVESSNYLQQLIPVKTDSVINISITDKDTSVDISGTYLGAFVAEGNSTQGYSWIVTNGATQSSSLVITGKRYITVYPKNKLDAILARFNIQVEIGSEATSYEPYNGATYTINLNGTRYGGTLDVTNGTMDDTLDHIASYNGETLPSTWISDRDVYAEGTTPTIGAEVVYTRATPITVQLAPTPVKSIEGTNNIFADCGQIIEVKYFKKA